MPQFNAYPEIADLSGSDLMLVYDVSMGAVNTVTVDTLSGTIEAIIGNVVAPSTATYILKTSNEFLTNAIVLADLSTGIIKVTTGTGALTIAAGGTDSEYPLTFNSPLTRVGNVISVSIGAITLTGDVNGPSGANVLSTVTVAKGGTNITSYSQGDLVYASGATTLVALAKSASATRYLSNTGTTNNPAWAQVNLANGVTGNLPVTNLNSGTGATGTTFWCGNGTWGTPSGGGGGTFSGAMVNLTGDQSTANNTEVHISWAAASYDTDSYWSAGSPTKLTAPATGYYHVSANLRFASNATGLRQVYIGVNGTTVQASVLINPTSTQLTDINLGMDVHLTAGDYVDLVAYQTSGGSLNVTNSGATRLAIHKIN